MPDSPLVTKFIPAYAGNYTRNRAAYGKISEICLHHTGSTNNTIYTLGALWQRVGRNGSSHYGVGGPDVGQYVREADVAWTNSNWGANCRAVTIETCNSGGAPSWPIADNTLETLIKLVADIAKRNGLHPLVCGKSLTWHSMYAATTCPGPYLKGKLQYIVDRANEINSADAAPLPEDPPEAGGAYRVQAGAFKVKGNAERYAERLEAAGFKTYVRKVGDTYNVQLGYFKDRKNAELYRLQLVAAGYPAIIKEA